MSTKCKVAELLVLTMSNFTIVFYICEQIEKDDDVELSNTASTSGYNVCNYVPEMQQVDWSY